VIENVDATSSAAETGTGTGFETGFETGVVLTASEKLVKE
jgi:hypothetical protein